jgi:hypothetical protein
MTKFNTLNFIKNIKIERLMKRKTCKRKRNNALTQVWLLGQKYYSKVKPPQVFFYKSKESNINTNKNPGVSVLPSLEKECKSPPTHGSTSKEVINLHTVPLGLENNVLFYAARFWKEIKSCIYHAQL